MSKHHTAKWCRPEKRYAIYARDNFTCAYCNQKFDAGYLQLDHIIPACMFSPKDPMKNHESNLITSCVKCNNLKGAMLIEIFVADYVKVMQIKNQAMKPIDRKLGATIKAQYTLSVAD